MLDELVERHRKANQLLSGWRAKAELASKKATSLDTRKSLPGFFSLNNLGIVCGKEFMDAVEALEPDVHQFIPIKLDWKDGSPTGRPSWVINCCVRLDSVAEEHSSVHRHPKIPSQANPDLYHYRFDKGPQKLAVHRDRVAGHAMWWDARFHGFMWSDALWEATRAAGLKGFDLIMDVAEV